MWLLLLLLLLLLLELPDGGLGLLQLSTGLLALLFDRGQLPFDQVVLLCLLSPSHLSLQDINQPREEEVKRGRAVRVRLRTCFNLTVSDVKSDVSAFCSTSSDSLSLSDMPQRAASCTVISFIRAAPYQENMTPRCPNY